MPLPPGTPADGGGAITFVPGDMPVPLRLLRELLPAALLATVGGGGTTFGPSELPDPVAPFERTVGGGGTTSVVPKILPIRLLTYDPLPVWVGGGGTTLFEESGMLPLAKCLISCERSVEGGGATTDRVGKLSTGSRVLARSGDATGGGTTETFAICTGALESCRLTPPGAGGMTVAAIAGAERLALADTVGAGATTLGLSEGPADALSRLIRGAGAITVGSRAGATRACSLATPGAGGITVALRFGAERKGSRCAEGEGAITESSCTPLRV